MRVVLLGVLVLCACPPVLLVPEPAIGLNDQCVIAYARDDLDQADAYCDHALEYQPKYWNALHNKGLIQLARGNRVAAKEFFIKALRANPQLASSLNMMGVLYLEERDFKTARGQFLAALNLQPEFLDARRNLAKAHLGLNDFEAAEKAYRHVIISAPNDFEGYQSLGQISLLRDRPADAVPWFQQALRLDANAVDSWKGLGASFTRLGRREEAKDAFASCLDAKAQDPECLAAIKELSE